LLQLYEAVSNRKSRSKPTAATQARSLTVPLNADPCRLRVVLASAFSSAFVIGVSRNVQKKTPPSGFDPRRSITISEVPHQLNNMGTIENLFAAWDLEVTKFQQSGGGRGVVVELAADARIGREEESPERLVHDHSKNVKLANQLFQDKRRKLEVKNPMFVAGGTESQETLVIKGMAPFRNLSWKLVEDPSEGR